MKQRDYCKKVDIFSLGIILYELCTLKRPYDSKKDIKINPPKPFPQDKFNPEVHILILKMLEKDPSKRPTIDEILTSNILKHPLMMITEHAIFNDDIAYEIKSQVDKIKKPQP